ncbi:MAG TPA: ATP-binding protein, partial [Gemmatimonadaceae bacterium]|nr:ATP-binding protein [Gemmatimonadaceae bacterium]
NAIKFTAVGGSVTVSCASSDETVSLSVADTGRGIESTKLERIFEPFVQIDRHLTNVSQQGVGLGLAISRDLARRMGGDITARSAVGKGSTFTLVLPRTTAARGAAMPGGSSVKSLAGEVHGTGRRS